MSIDSLWFSTRRFPSNDNHFFLALAQIVISLHHTTMGETAPSSLLQHHWKHFLLLCSLRKSSTRCVCYFVLHFTEGFLYPLWQYKSFSEIHWTDLFWRVQSWKMACTVSAENASCQLNKCGVYIYLLMGIGFSLQIFSMLVGKISIIETENPFRLAGFLLGDWLVLCSGIGWIFPQLIRDRDGFRAKMYFWNWPF